MLAKQANETQTCCDNPIYVKIKPVHLMHVDAPGEVYAQRVKVGGFMARLLEAEGVPPQPLKLGCSAKAQTPGLAATSMVMAVTCPDCLEWFKSSKLPTPDISEVESDLSTASDISVTPDLPQEPGSLSEIRSE
jgi:hypothetical protein